MDTLRSVLGRFAVTVDSDDLKKFGDLIDSVKDKVRVFGAAFAAGAAAKGFAKFTGDQIEAGFQLRRTAQMLGTTTDELQAWEHSANMAGESTDKFNRALRFMLKNEGKAELGIKAGVQEFSRWGLAVKNANGSSVGLFDRVAQFSDKLVAMKTQAERTRGAMAIFGIAGAQVLPWLMQGSAAIKEQLQDWKDLGAGMSEEFVEASEKTAKQLRRVETALKGVYSEAVKPLLPYIEEAAKVFANFAGKMVHVAKTSEMVKAALYTIGAVVGAGLLYAIAAGIAAITVSVASLTLALQAAGIGLIIAGFTMLYLVIEDLMVACEGGDSAILKVLEDLFGVGAAQDMIKALKEGWVEFKNALTNMLPDLKVVGKTIIDMFQDALPIIVKLGIFGVGVAKLLIGAFTAASQAMQGLWEGAFNGDFVQANRHFDKALKAIDKAGDSFVDPESTFGKAAGMRAPGTIYGPDGQPKQQGMYGGAFVPTRDLSPSIGLPPAQSTFGPLAGTGPVSFSTTATIHVTGAQEPKEVAREVAKKLSDVNRQTADGMGAITPLDSLGQYKGPTDA